MSFHDPGLGGWSMRKCLSCNKIKKFSRKSKRNWYKTEGPADKEGNEPILVCAYCAGKPYLSKKRNN